MTDPLIGRVLLGRYKVLRRIGAGSMGFVHEVEHTVIGRRFALKTLQPAFASKSGAIKRFQKEARAAARVGHDAIVSVTDMGVLEDGIPFIVMELLEGTTVGQELASSGPFELSRAVGIALACCGALGAAHRAGILHRDVKPDNIFLAHAPGLGEHVKLVDFGVSRIRESMGLAESYTQAGSMLGTPYYMSAEQFEGRPDLDERADVYSLGVVLFEMLSGRVPYQGNNIVMLMTQVCSGPVPSLRKLVPAIPIELDAIVASAMATSRDQRIPSMDAFAKALRPVLASVDPESARPPAPGASLGVSVGVLALSAERPDDAAITSPHPVPSWVDEPTDADAEVLRRVLADRAAQAESSDGVGTLIGVGEQAAAHHPAWAATDPAVPHRLGSRPTLPAPRRPGTAPGSRPTLPAAFVSGADPGARPSLPSAVTGVASEVSPSDPLGDTTLPEGESPVVALDAGELAAAGLVRASAPGPRPAPAQAAPARAEASPVPERPALAPEPADVQAETGAMDRLELAGPRRARVSWTAWAGVGLIALAVVGLAFLLLTR